MKVFFDTNVIIDAITCRDNDFKDSQDLVRYVINGEIVGVISSKQITDIYFILRKYLPTEEKRREIISLIINSFEVLPTLKSEISYCLKSNIFDLEDAILDEIAKINMIKYLVTNDLKHFINSELTVLSPKDLRLLLKSKEG